MPFVCCFCFCFSAFSKSQGESVHHSVFSSSSLFPDDFAAERDHAERANRCCLLIGLLCLQQYDRGQKPDRRWRCSEEPHIGDREERGGAAEVQRRSKGRDEEQREKREGVERGAEEQRRSRGRLGSSSPISSFSRPSLPPPPPSLSSPPPPSPPLVQCLLFRYFLDILTLTRF